MIYCYGSRPEAPEREGEGVGGGSTFRGTGAASNWVIEIGLGRRSLEEVSVLHLLAALQAAKTIGEFPHRNPPRHGKKNVRYFKDVFLKTRERRKKKRISLQSSANLRLSFVCKETFVGTHWKPRKAGDLPGIGARYQENPLVFTGFSTFPCFQKTSLKYRTFFSPS